MFIIYLIIILLIIATSNPNERRTDQYFLKNLSPTKLISLFMSMKFLFTHKHFALSSKDVNTILDRLVLDAFIARLSAWSFESANILLAKRKKCACVLFCTSRSEDCNNFQRDSLYLYLRKYCKINRKGPMNKF
jgi:hypothetical protein